MAIDRRTFLSRSGQVVAGTGLVGVGLAGCESSRIGPQAVSKNVPSWIEGHLFQHGVASGDPLSDRVILWTRVSPAPAVSRAAMAVSWWIARDPAGRDRIAEGEVKATPDRDFTVKVDAIGLEPATDYYYSFAAGDPGAAGGRFRSPLGRTRTLPVSGVEPVRFASMSCANFPEGFFNAYATVAQSDDLDFVIHLGDYLYEYGNGQYGNGTEIGREVSPDGETIRLDDYRLRHATYKRDLDLQAAHARHPWITIWDDHESANDSSAVGARNHQPENGEGEWSERRLAAMRAYQEWMPIRELPTGLFRRFQIGELAELIMLDARLAGRDAHVLRDDQIGASDPTRSILGAKQEALLRKALSESQSSGQRWKILGQSSPFSPLTDGKRSFNPDTWDGYRGSRRRVLEQIRDEAIDGVVILSGDYHSSWAFEVPAPLGQEMGDGSEAFAVEFVAPAVSSQPLGAHPKGRNRFDGAFERHPHLRYLDVQRNGFVRVELSFERVRAEWVFTGDRRTRSATAECGAVFESRFGTNRLRRMDEADCARPESDAS